MSSYVGFVIPGGLLAPSTPGASLLPASPSGAGWCVAGPPTATETVYMAVYEPSAAPVTSHSQTSPLAALAESNSPFDASSPVNSSSNQANANGLNNNFNGGGGGGGGGATGVSGVSLPPLPPLARLLFPRASPTHAYPHCGPMPIFLLPSEPLNAGGNGVMGAAGNASSGSSNSTSNDDSSSGSSSSPSGSGSGSGGINVLWPRSPYPMWELLTRADRYHSALLRSLIHAYNALSAEYDVYASVADPAALAALGLGVTAPPLRLPACLIASQIIATTDDDDDDDALDDAEDAAGRAGARKNRARAGARASKGPLDSPDSDGDHGNLSDSSAEATPEVATGYPLMPSSPTAANRKAAAGASSSNHKRDAAAEHKAPGGRVMEPPSPSASSRSANAAAPAPAPAAPFSDEPVAVGRALPQLRPLSTRLPTGAIHPVAIALAIETDAAGVTRQTAALWQALVSLLPACARRVRRVLGKRAAHARREQLCSSIYRERFPASTVASMDDPRMEATRARYARRDISLKSSQFEYITYIRFCSISQQLIIFIKIICVSYLCVFVTIASQGVRGGPLDGRPSGLDAERALDGQRRRPPQPHGPRRRRRRGAVRGRGASRRRHGRRTGRRRYGHGDGGLDLGLAAGRGGSQRGGRGGRQ